MAANWDKFNEKLSNIAKSVQGVSDVASTASATIGNAVGSYKAGKAAANGRAINDIQANVEISDDLKIIAFALIAVIGLIFLKVKSK